MLCPQKAIAVSRLKEIHNSSMSIHFINVPDIQQNFDAKTANKQPYVPQAITSA